MLGERTRGAGEHTKHSHGLAEFVSSIRGRPGLSILDLGEICQPNVSFVISLGHRLYSEDFLRTLDSAYEDVDEPDGLSPRQRLESFLQHSLEYPDQHFDGVLAWDTLQYLPEYLLVSTVARLFDLLRPGSCLLAFFHTGEVAENPRAYSYRIVDGETLHLAPRGQRSPAQFFTNRGIEKLFRSFHSVKFFLSRDNLREVLVKR